MKKKVEEAHTKQTENIDEDMEDVKKVITAFIVKN